MKFFMIYFLSGSSLLISTLFFMCFCIYQLRERYKRQSRQCTSQDDPPSYEEVLMLPEYTI